MASGDSALTTLVHAIVAHDKRAVHRLLVVSPELANARAEISKARPSTEPYFDDINHYFYGGDTALHIAASAYEPEIIRLLIANGAEVGAKNRRGAQPLHYAADGMPGAHSWNPPAQVAAIAGLIELGADPNATDKGGVTPLHRAVRTRCAEAVRALLDLGANPRHPSNSGMVPAQLAHQATGRGGSGSAEAKAQQQIIVELLQRHSTTADN
jgi:ankyrin repeat protein